MTGALASKMHKISILRWKWLKISQKLAKTTSILYPQGPPPKNFGLKSTHLYTGKLIVILKALLHIKIVLFCLINHNYKIIWNAWFDGFPSGLINPSKESIVHVTPSQNGLFWKISYTSCFRWKWVVNFFTRSVHDIQNVD